MNPPPRFPWNVLKPQSYEPLETGKLLARAKGLCPGSPFRISTADGESIHLPSEFAEELRNDRRFHFGEIVTRNSHGHTPGFLFHNLTIDHLAAVTKWRLTKSLEWREVQVSTSVLNLVTRLSARVFVGPELCRNDEWLRLTHEYTLTLVIAGARLRSYPKFIRPVVHWFLPECKTLRAQNKDAQRVIGSVIDKRRAMKAKAGGASPDFNDALQWAEGEAAGQPYEPAFFQLGMSFVAIHTTTDLLSKFMVQLAESPEFFAPLREEIAMVIGASGWEKASLHGLKLLDSALKETQRLKPAQTASMFRYGQADVKLSNGLDLRRGDRVVVDMSRMRDPTVYENPFKWDPYRFLRMRDGDNGSQALLVTAAGADHLGFGYGVHACPGRFFAANEVKIALCHILVKYEWTLVAGTTSQEVVLGFELTFDPTSKIMIRRHNVMEVDI
ncbi:cytochrome P450 [Xylariaceae sp. FL1272]|nr:cytochrome P450 [Xylariaceae sp. FL1272]